MRLMLLYRLTKESGVRVRRGERRYTAGFACNLRCPCSSPQRHPARQKTPPVFWQAVNTSLIFLDAQAFWFRPLLNILPPLQPSPATLFCTPHICLFHFPVMQRKVRKTVEPLPIPVSPTVGIRNLVVGGSTFAMVADDLETTDHFAHGEESQALG